MYFISFVFFYTIFSLTNGKLIKLSLNKVQSDQHETIFLANNSENPFVRPLINAKDVQFFTTIYVGSTNQPMTVLVDTGSNLLWLPSSNIVGRFSTNTYNYLLSSTFTNLNQTKYIDYTKGRIEGIMASDKVSLNENTTVSKQNFLLVTHATGIKSLASDGVLGLNIDDEGNSQNSFIQQLYAEKTISSPSFALHISENGNKSTLLIGNIADSNELDSLRNKMGKCSVPSNSKMWECPLDVVNVNGKNITVISKVVFDSGVSYMIIPINDFKLIRNDTISNKTCAMNRQNQLLCKCVSPSEFPGMNLLVNGYNISLTPDQLVSYQPQYEYSCRFNILLDLNIFGSWILGESALRGLLVSYDFTNRNIDFVKVDTLPDNIVFEPPKSGFNWWILLWILLAIAFLVLCYYLYRHCFIHNEGRESLIQKSR